MPSDCTAADVKALGHELLDRAEAVAMRAGVTRLYYANFLQACETVVPKLNVELKGLGEDHGKILKALRERRGRYEQVGSLLKQLLTYRHHADYHFGAMEKPDDCPFCSGKLTFTEESKKAIRETADSCFTRLATL